MPFKSKAQRKYLWANLPEIARKFADDTPSTKSKRLPERKKIKRSKDDSVQRQQN